MPNAGDAPPVEVAPVDTARWTDLERLFEAKGGPAYCWCMAWRSLPAAVDRSDNAARKAELERRVRNGEPVGLLAYCADEPVGWCSVAPRATYRPLGGHDYEGVAAADIWSIVCFFVRRGDRHRGVARRLLEAAVEHAAENGAAVIEAYPVDPDSPSYRFMGFVETFTAAGFEEVGRAGTRRHVMARMGCSALTSPELLLRRPTKPED
jgi:GNAT superfamily N-acetyltransferase